MTQTSPTMSTLTDFYGPPISEYSRAQAFEDGILVDVSTDAAEAGFRIPVALTRAVYEDCVVWDGRDRALRPRQCQDERGRLWDVLWMGALAARRATAEHVVFYRIKRVPRPGHGPKSLVTLKLHLGPGDDGRAAITIMEPDED